MFVKVSTSSGSRRSPLPGLPTLIATWFVWLPVVAVLYSLPPLLQIPVYSLALCFWALMLAYIHARPARVA